MKKRLPDDDYVQRKFDFSNHPKTAKKPEKIINKDVKKKETEEHFIERLKCLKKIEFLKSEIYRLERLKDIRGLSEEEKKDLLSHQLNLKNLQEKE